MSSYVFFSVFQSETMERFSLRSNARIVLLGIVDMMVKKPDFLPLSIPRPISEQLLKLHSNPPAFFVGQFLWYLMRNVDQLAKMLKLSISLIPYGKGPIVGLQIRRTDKIGTEAALHTVDEYMQWTEIWYKIQEKRVKRNITRRIFVATDDPSVFSEIKQKYAQYELYGDEKTANTAKLDSRYTESSLYGVIRDIRLLSLCDYIVCTFSSQVCRMGFELMQIQQGDAGDHFHSLDDIYYFGGQHAHEVVAVEDHNPERNGEIELRVGDVIGIAGNHWDGFSKGVNRRTGADGLYPSYKVSDNLSIDCYRKMANRRLSVITLTTAFSMSTMFDLSGILCFTKRGSFKM
ncbi:variant SH3 domain protein [Dictyocaulus viviparus]|uniref:Variant SH3 domain protein n=1 Tax=Dictyocaulus viviparus TaxID=29172 RepID=A0A0D8XDB7_DICVI|nr:variant SH3 domain protein [Dictyocaulus viviparus]